MFDVEQEQPKISGVNFAPAKPLTRLKEDSDTGYEVSDLASFARELYLDIRERNKEERREHAEAARLMSNLRSGKLEMKRDPVFGRLALLERLPRRTQQDRHIYPLAQVNSTQLTSIWTLARPKILPRHFGTTNKAQIQAAMIEKVIDHYFAEWMDEYFHQQESLAAMDYGTIAIRTDYDNTLNQLKQLMPVIEDAEETVFEGYGHCRECGHEGTPETFGAADAMPQCPECGDYNIGSLVPAQTVSVPKIVGVEEVVQGDIRIDLVPIPTLNWDLSKLIQHSPWVHQRKAVSKRLAESILKISVIENDGADDYALQVMNETGARGASVEGWGRENGKGHYQNYGNVAIMEEVWFKPEMYAGTKLSKDEMTVSGETIPRNTPLEKIFPQGMCIVGFNDMSVLSGVFNEKCHIRSTVYHIQSNSGIGKGTTDAIEISEHLNVAHSAAMAVIKRFGAGGGHWYDQDVLTSRQAAALLKPGGLVGVRMRGTQYTSVEQVLRKIEAGTLDQGNMAMLAQLANMMNITFQTTDFTSGVADNRVDVNTLGGQQLLQAQNQQRSAAPLRMKAYLHAGVGEDVVSHFRSNMRLPKVFGKFDKYGLTKAKYITGADIPEHIRCDAVPDSELPTNKLTKRDNFERMMEKMGQSGTPYLEIVATSPRVASWIADNFNVELPLFNYTEMLTVCQDRLDQVKDAALMYEQAGQLSGYQEDPSIVGDQIIMEISPPIEPTEENHDIKAQILAEYLDDDEVKEWTPYQRAAVQALIWAHHKANRDFRFSIQGLEQEGALGLQAQAAEAARAIQAPMMADQQAMNAQGQPDPEAEAAAAQEAEMMARLGDEMQATTQFSRDEEAADNQLKRDMELEKVRAKARPKPEKKGKK